MKALKTIKYFFVLICIMATSISCNNSSYTTNNSWNLASIYNPLQTILHPSYKVFHNAENTSVLFIKIRTSELFFRPNFENDIERCSFTIKYYLQEVNDESQFIVDTNTYVYEFSKSDLNKYYITQIPIKAIKGYSYRLKVTIKDNYRKSFSISYINVEKSTELGEQHFNLTTLNGTPIFKNVIINDGVFKVHHQSSDSNKLYVSYYKNEIDPPKPIISTPSDNSVYKKRDSLYVLEYDKNTVLSLSHDGLYFMQFDTNNVEGLSVLKLNKDFPKVQDPDGLIPPLSYIVTDIEYRKLLEKSNPKLTADNFWINAGGNISRGRELIRIFYNRVYFANYYFTNTKPGWKTDRGMIYVVYGPPHEIEKSAFSETWKYKLKSEGADVKFTFKYAPNKFGINKYNLSRANNQEWRWTEAVYAWTSGDLFIYD